MKYFIDVEYSGSEFTAEFNLIDSNNICIPGLIKQFMIEWLNDKMPDVYLMDYISKGKLGDGITKHGVSREQSTNRSSS